MGSHGSISFSCAGLTFNVKRISRQYKWWSKVTKKTEKSYSTIQLDHGYRTLVEIHLRYANVIWGSLPKSKLNTLKHLQDRARSIIDNARQKDGWSHNWLTVEQLIKFDRSVMTYKIINKQCPESFWDKYHQRTQLSNRITRNCSDFQIPRNNLEYVKKGFHYSTLKAWNDIRIDIRDLPTLSRFKKQLKGYFKS